MDKFYAEGGVNTQFFAGLFFAFTGMFIWVLIYAILKLSVSDNIIHYFLGCLIPLPFMLWSGFYLLKEWFKWTHYPIRLNRKNKMVYVYRTNGTVLSVAWNDIYFTQDKEPGPLNEWSIRGHILDKKGEIVLETFSLGICAPKSYMSEYWEFIRCYMEEDVVPELAELIMFYPPIEDRKEGFIFGLQNRIYMESRLEWIFFPFILPLNLVASVCRYITSQTGKIPRWPEDVQAACQPEADDPVNFSAANNPKDMWQLVFANQPESVWKEKYDRMTDATDRIHEVLEKRYGKRK